MTFEEFRDSLTGDSPPKELNELLTSLWYDAKGDWDKSHEIAQSVGGRDAAWVHAYLHRKEGDLGNAGYWYSMAGREMPDVSLEEEWENITKELISQS